MLAPRRVSWRKPSGRPVMYGKNLMGDGMAHGTGTQVVGTRLVRFGFGVCRFGARALPIGAWLMLLIGSRVVAQEEPVPALAQENLPADHPLAHVSQSLGMIEAKAGRNADADPDLIEQWVRDLDANHFAKRKVATTELQEVGSRMVPMLIQAMQTGESVEQRVRGFQILHSMATSQSIDDEVVAYAAIRKFADDPNRSLRMRARKSLRSIEPIYKQRALARLQALGGEFRTQLIYDPMTGRIVARPMDDSPNRAVFGQNWRGKDSDLELLAFVAGLQQVDFQGPSFDDEMLEMVGRCKTLRVLKIRRAKITDQGLASLEGLTELAILDIRYSDQITDQAVPNLVMLQPNVALRLYGTKVTPKAASELVSRLPAGASVDVRRGGFFGVASQTTNIRGLPQDACVIDRPVPNSGAEAAGLIQDDVILKYDGKDVLSFEQLRNLIAANAPGDEVAIVIRRGKNEMEKTVKLGEWPDESG